MILYYDRDGLPMEQQRAWQLMGDIEYARVARTTVMDAADPSITFDVSTVWLGLDHRLLPGGPPLIFETMVFDSAGDTVDQDRYATLAQASAGHTAMVVEVSAPLVDAIVVDAETSA